MNHAYQTKCTVEGVFDQPYNSGTHIIVAPDRETAKKISVEQLKGWLGIKKKKKATFAVDCEEIKGVLGKIIVIMADFSSVYIGVSANGDPVLVHLNDGRRFKAETVSKQFGIKFVVTGHIENDPKVDSVPIGKIRGKDLNVILASLEGVIGKKTPPFLRQATLLEDLIKERSVYGNHIPSRVLGLPGVAADAGATFLQDNTGKAVLLHWELNGDFSRAMLIPESEFEDTDRVVEAIEAFVND